LLIDPEWLPWFCVLAPDAVADPVVPIRKAETALATYPAGIRHYTLGILGAALYRAGRLDEAIRRLELSDRDWTGVGVARNWAFLAMAHHRMGHREDARRWLEKLRAYAPGNATQFFWESVEIGILRREAESLISHAEIPADPFQPPRPG
jgi:tetratricopeptide (TPR) repeat protein